MHNETTWTPGNVAQATLTERQLFIRRTYAHVLAAVIAFVGASYALYTAGVGRRILEWMGTSQYSWLLILGAFMVVGWIATTMAALAKPGIAYLGLALEVVIQALIFSPMLYLAHNYYPGILPQATILTGLIFGGLTMYVFLTKKDFSWMGPALLVIGLGAVGVIVMSVIFGWNLGAWFSLIMIVFASAVILYTTSKVAAQVHEHAIRGGGLGDFRRCGAAVLVCAAAVYGPAVAGRFRSARRQRGGHFFLKNL